MPSEPPTLSRLRAAREKLDARDLPGALAIYEEVLAGSGERGDVLMTISGDLGSTGHPEAIVELISPRYDPERHGPAPGINLLQAYLAVGNAPAAQHLLDLLFSLKRPELEERLHGFSRAITELVLQASAHGSFEATLSALERRGVDAEQAEQSGRAVPAPPKVALASVSRPIWAYGLEGVADLLPPKQAKLRRVAFAQLSLPGLPNPEAVEADPGHELARLARGLPMWLAETFYFSPHYAPVAALSHRELPDGFRRPMIFGQEWSPANVRELADSSTEGVDYLFIGSLQSRAGDYEAALRVWEVRKFRERKLFTARWTPATADAALAGLQREIRRYMEWSAYPDGAGLAYAEPASPRAWLDVLESSLELFFAGKGVISPPSLADPLPVLKAFAPMASAGAAASLAWLTLLSRALALGLPAEVEFPPLAADPRVAAAQAALGL